MKVNVVKTLSKKEFAHLNKDVYYSECNIDGENAFCFFTRDNELVGLYFADVELALKEVRKNFPTNNFILSKENHDNLLKSSCINIIMVGTYMQCSVWKELLNIPKGKTVNYKTIAEKLGMPKSSRAVANAISKNPVSYFVPCHRVVPKYAKIGACGGYRFGSDLKTRLLEKESNTKFCRNFNF